VIAFLKVTRRGVVAVDSTCSCRCCMSKVTLIDWVTQRTRLYIALLAEASLFGARELRTVWIHTTVGTWYLFCVAVRIPAGVWCTALCIGRTWHDAF
jgi:hypothetical protein